MGEAGREVQVRDRETDQGRGPDGRLAEHTRPHKSGRGQDSGVEEQAGIERNQDEAEPDAVAARNHRPNQVKQTGSRR